MKFGFTRLIVLFSFRKRRLKMLNLSDLGPVIYKITVPAWSLNDLDLGLPLIVMYSFI